MGKVKVVGYAKKEFFNDGIVHRNFTDALVGQQFATDGGTPIATIANFNITTNLEPTPSKIFNTNKFSKFLTLKDINVTQEENETIKKNILTAEPNHDETDLSTHALFGSLKERMRVALENIIMKWPASIHVTDIDPKNALLTGYTAKNYSYDPVNDITTFEVNNDRFINKFNLNYLKSGNIIEDFNPDTKLRNFTRHHDKFVVSNEFGDFPVVSYTGSLKPENEDVKFKVRGNAFPNLTSSTKTKVSYHVKPNKIEREKFFSELGELESLFLNRFKSPKFTAEFRYPEQSSTGVVVHKTKTLSWPTSDGYNIDFETAEYTRYVSELINIAESYDSTKGDVVTRFLTANALSEFDTVATDLSLEQSNFAGQKMTSLFRIYGREFDRIKRKIDGISFANVVSYDKRGNSPDALIKDLAKVLGWETLTPIFENDILNSFLNTKDSQFSGQERGYSDFEAEIELWRRLVLNTPWLWKSKGTRKAIEFLLRFIGAPKNLITLNEYVYVADSPQNMDIFLQLLEKFQGSTNTGNISVDDEGYPSPLRNTSDLYFQQAGLWFRETGGENAVIDKLKGNNPHVGPYDGGNAYLDQFRCLIPDFSATTLMDTVTTRDDRNIFRNYNKGMVNRSGSTVYATVVNEDNVPISGCPAIVKQIIVDPYEGREINECGCPDGDHSIELCIDQDSSSTTISYDQDSCDVDSFELADDGVVYFTLEDGTVTSEVNSECCESFGFTSIDCDGDDVNECVWKDIENCGEV